MKKVVVIPNTVKDKDFLVTKRLIDCLSEYAEVSLDKTLKSVFPEKYIKEDIYADADFAIVIGGDGTILQAAFSCAKKDIPILGINLGRIGFMNEVEVDEIEDAVKSLFSDDFIIEERMMLKVTFKKNGEEKKYHALNDVVISKTDNSKLISMDLFSKDEMINRYIADGLIISTPTGSTGYNLSAGGPVVNPLMELFVATPMCAHMLTARPAIMPACDELKVILNENGENSALVTVDGEVVGKIDDGDEVLITESVYKTKIIKIKRESFYSIFTGKLS